ncbi:hypothetical protein OEZ85_013742 [Tetradesmus obliquus]|uniref:CFA20 domain-containing protein n=1 Tax=Tetradesmus obliquus TaxID=3088 RepID=A0ABY8U8S2_TETOB|nr:hypothetical protein OEZ85_013742 [Tetradesmus obliquus]
MAEAQEWQHPFVNVFKLCGVEQQDQQKRDAEISGKVAARMDDAIHKRVLRITGAIPAVNYLKLPKSRGFALHGRFCYLQVRFEQPSALFSIHLEAVTADGNTCRISIGNIFKAENVKKKAGCIQFTMKDPPSCWMLLSVDLAAAVAVAAAAGSSSSSSSSGSTQASPYSHLKGMQLCSTLTVRSAFTSDIRFGLQTLPREMVLCHSLEPSQLAQLWLPAEPVGVPEPPLNKPIRPKLPRTPLLQPEPFMSIHRVNGFTGEYARSVLYCAETDELVYPAGAVVVAMAAGNSSSSSSSSSSSQEAAGAVAAHAAAAVSAAGNSGCSVAVQQQLQEGSMKRPQGSQRFFVGHSAFVCCLALGGQGQLLATGQEGKAALIRVWDFRPGQQQQPAETWSTEDDTAMSSNGTCLAVLCAHASRLAALDVSADGRALVAAGCDSQGRQVIALWDISGIRQGGRAQLLVSHESHHNVRVLRFCPFEPDTFLSAGRDSVRTYRLKVGSLRALSVRLEPPVNKKGQVVGTATAAVASGPKIFTDLGCEAGSAALQLPTQHVFAATASGAVFQIDYARRCVVAVYQLHVGAINALAIGEGFAATASDDASLRLWPLDFSAYLLEAQHEAPVTSVALTAGGLGLAAGCEDGLLGLLGVASRRYAALMRSHCGPVACVVPHHERPEYCTASADGSVRIWDITSHQQLYEFGGGSSSRTCGAPTAAAYNPRAYQLAVGYSSGLLRLFDVATTTLLLEQQQHKGAVTQLLFAPDGSRLLSCGADGKLVACDASTQCAAAAAEAGAGGATISVFAASSLEAVLCIETTAQGFTRLEFSADSQDLWASTVEASVQDDSSSGGPSCSALRFCANSGSLLQVLPNPHGAAAVTAFALGPCGVLLATGGADHLVKLWAVSSRQELAAAAQAAQQGRQEQPQQQAAGPVSVLPAYQSFTGHSGAVTGAAFLGNQLLTVGQDGNVAVWNMHSSSSSSNTGGRHGHRMQHPDLNVTMRSWLERPTAAAGSNSSTAGFATAGVQQASLPSHGSATPAVAAGGVMLPELHAAHSDPEVLPSPLFSASGPYQQHLSLRGPSSSTAAGGPAVPAPVRCSWLLGLNTSAHGSLLWLRQRGLVAHPAGTVLVLTDLASHSQRHLQHHSLPISAAAASSDGCLLATAPAGPEPASGCAEVCVWDAAAGTLRHVLRQHACGVGLLAFSPDSCWLVSVSAGASGGLLVLWDLQAGEAAAVGKTQKAVCSIAWMPWQLLPTFLTCGGYGLLLWSLAPSFLEQRQLTVPDAAGAAFTAMCSAASSGCLPHSSMAGQPLDPAQQEAQQEEEAGTAFAADECGTVWQLAVGGGSLLGCVAVARLPPGEVATQLQWSQPSAALAVATSSGRLLRYSQTSSSSSSSTPCQCDGAAGTGLVASMCDEGWLALWRMGGQKQALPLADFRSEHAVTAVAFLPGHSSCVVGYADGRLALLDLAPAAAAADAAVSEQPGSSQHSAGSLGAVRWSVARHASPVVSLALNPCQPLVMAASRDGLISVTNLESSRLVACCQDLTGTITPLHMLAVNTSAAPAAAAHGNSSAGAAASNMAAAAWLDRVLVFSAPWQASSAAVQSSYQCPEVPASLTSSRSSVAFIPGSTKLLLFSSPCLQAAALLLDATNGQPLRELQLPGCPSSSAVSPCGQLLAFGLHDGRVLLVDAAGDASSELGACAGRVPVAAVTFAAGGKRLLAAARSIVTVWDA